MATYPSSQHPPTPSQLADARVKLRTDEESADQLRRKIEHAEEALEQIIKDSRCAIAAMESDRKKLEREIEWTRSFIAPIRRLPDEMLREIFWHNFEDHPCCAWVLAAVCSVWRRLALNMPRLWSKIRLVTTPNASPDTIRLWLERSGTRVPLDIEIFLHVAVSSAKRSHSPPSPWSPPLQPADWHPFHAGGIVLPPPIHHAAPHNIPHNITPPPINTWISPRSPRPVCHSSTQSRTNTHWGHIAMFYLTEQMSRWQRFVFRFDRQFSSMAALKSINGQRGFILSKFKSKLKLLFLRSGDAPILEEFEVSCGEPVIYSGDWPWLPSVTKSCAPSLPKLISVTIHYLPFKWSSPMLVSGLRSMTLRSLPSVQIYPDRLLHIISSNPHLEQLSLNFHNAQPAVLSLNPTTLPELKKLTLGGHYLLGTLLDTLNLPSLESLTLDIEPRESMEDAITNLLTRSNNPPLTHLSLSYGGQALYYAGGGPFPWTFLSGLNQIRELQIGQTSFESLIGALATADDDHGQWLLPNLTHLALKSCHPHGDGGAKLVLMVEARNPPIGGAGGPHPVVLGVGAAAAGAGGGGGAMAAVNPGGPPAPWGPPVRLKRLEMYDCAALGEDILKWLRSRIEEVKFTEPIYPRTPRSPSYGYA